MTRQPPLLAGLARGGGAVARACDSLAAAEARIGAILRGLDGVSVLAAPGWESLVADPHGAAASLAGALDRRIAARASRADRRIDARPRDLVQGTSRSPTIRPREDAARLASGAPEGTIASAAPRPPERERRPAAAPPQRAFASPDPVLAAAAARRIPAVEAAAGAGHLSPSLAREAPEAGRPDAAASTDAPVVQRLERVLARIERPQVAVEGNVEQRFSEPDGLGDRTPAAFARDPHRAHAPGPDGWPARPSSASGAPPPPTPTSGDPSDAGHAAFPPAAEASRRADGAFTDDSPRPAGARAPFALQPAAGANRNGPSGGWPDVPATARATFAPGGLAQPGASGLMRLLQRAEARGLVPPASAAPGRRVDGPGAVAPDRTPERGDIAAGAGRPAWPWSEAAPPVVFEDSERLSRMLSDLLRREARAAGIDLDGGSR